MAYTAKTAAKGSKTSKKTDTKVTKVDPYQMITDKIIAQLEQGVRPWTKPWTVTGADGLVRTTYLPMAMPRRSNGEFYKGVNILLLWGAAQAAGYKSAYWFTFNQAAQIKDPTDPEKKRTAHVRKGEKGTVVVFANAFTKEVENGKGETEEKRIPYLKTFVVFNADQIDGLPEHYYAPKEEPVVTPAPVAEEPKKNERIEACDQFFSAVGGEVKHGGNRAFYIPSQDYIQMPEFEAFRDSESYYATLGHEFVHWTGAESRVNRTFGKRFGDDAYAFEELIAELGSAFLCGHLGLSSEPRDDHAQYLASWLRTLRNDKKAIITAASAASKATAFLIDLSNGVDPLAKPKTEESEDAPVAEMGMAA